MVIILTLILAAISVSFLIVSVNLRSRSVSTLNLLMCFAAVIVIQPWSSLTIHPPVDPELREAWVATMVWIFIFTASVFGWMYCFMVTAEKKEPKKSRRRRKRSRRDRGSESSDSAS